MLLRYCIRYASFVCVLVLLGCSWGGATATCSSSRSCPDGLLCNVDRGLCMKPSDLDLAGSSVDLAMRDLSMPPPPGSRVCPDVHWCWQNPLPQPQSLAAIWGSGPSDVWTAGLNNTVLHGNGISWTQLAVPGPASTNFRAIWGRSPRQVWIAGSSGTMLFWDGSKFTTQTTGTSESLFGLWGDDSSVWAVGSGGTVLKFDGAGWTAQPTGITQILMSIWGSTASNIWAVGEAGAACHYTGTAWSCGTEFGGAYALTIAGVGPDDVWAMGYSPSAWHWNGTGWSAMARGASDHSMVASFVSGPKSIWAAGWLGATLHYDGSSWSSQIIAVPGRATTDWYAMWGSSPDNIFAVGYEGEIMHFDGTSFQSQNSGWESWVNALWGTSERDLWAFDDSGVAHHFDGNLWTATTLGSTVSAAGGSAADNVWAGTMSGGLLHYDGSRWTPLSPLGTGIVRSIYFAAADRMYVGSDTDLEVWDGVKFTVSNKSATSAMWGTGPKNIWAGRGHSAYCELFHYDGTSWTLMKLPGCTGTIVGLHGTDDNDVYAVSETNSNVYHWDGSNFTALSTPSTSGKLGVYATASRVFVTSDIGEILVREGGAWSTAQPCNVSKMRLGSILGFGASSVWVGGAGGFVLSYQP